MLLTQIVFLINSMNWFCIYNVIVWVVGISALIEFGHMDIRQIQNMALSITARLWKVSISSVGAQYSSIHLVITNNKLSDGFQHFIPQEFLHSHFLKCIFQCLLCTPLGFFLHQPLQYCMMIHGYPFCFTPFLVNIKVAADMLPTQRVTTNMKCLLFPFLCHKFLIVPSRW